MRRARLKPHGMPLFYHIYNRVAGEPGYFPFGPAEKEHFVRLLHKLNKLFTVRVVAYQVMSNHYHLVVHAPQEPPEPEEVCRRYAAYYGGKRRLDPSDPYCEVLAGGSARTILGGWTGDRLGVVRPQHHLSFRSGSATSQEGAGSGARSGTGTVLLQAAARALGI